MKKRGILRQHTMIGAYKLCARQGLGRGTFGEIFLVTRPGNEDEKFALKKILMSECSQKDKQHCLDEVLQLRETNHENIVKYVDSFEQDNCLCIVMEYCEGGNLRQYLNRHEGNLSENEFVTLLIQICRGLKNFHDRNIAHRDIKTTNILLTANKQIKIADLGLAKFIENVNKLTTKVGSPYFMSPEMLSGKAYTLKTDIWSLACCMYEMGTKTSLFEAKNIETLTDKVHTAKIPSFSEQLPYCEAIRTLFCDMLHNDSSRRPSVDQILETLTSLQRHQTKQAFTEDVTARVADVSLTGTKEKRVVRRRSEGERKERTKNRPSSRSHVGEQDFSKTCPPRFMSKPPNDSGIETELDMQEPFGAIGGNIVTVQVTMTEDQKEEYEEMQSIESKLKRKLSGNGGLMNQLKKEIAETRHCKNETEFLEKAQRILGSDLFKKCETHLKTYWIYRTKLLNISFRMA